jgi:hypothetical protein
VYAFSTRFAATTGQIPYIFSTRLSAAALFKFSELQMQRSLWGGTQYGEALFKKILFRKYNKNFYQKNKKVLKGFCH